MVNGKVLRVSPDFFDLVTTMGQRNNLSNFSVTQVIAVNLKTRQTEIIVPNRGKVKKVVVKQNDTKGFIDLF